LTEVELCEGVVEIGEESFAECHHSITKIKIPRTLRRIDNWAFTRSLRCPILLHDDIERIGEWAFASCIFTNFKVPPLITVIPHHMLFNCKSMFSLELPEIITEIKGWTFYRCYCLRNVAIPPNAVIGDDRIFVDEDIEANNHEISDLLQLFGSEAAIIRELQHRFDRLPIHRLVYYLSYHQGVLQILIAAINMRSGQRRTLRVKLDPTGNNQDCIGMTPLHILTCSSVHDMEVYRLIVENYPANLITEDRWGAPPLLYAFWGAAPAEIIQFLLESYQTLYPGYVFNWTMMVETMGRCDTPKERIENLLNVRLLHFPDQPLDWDYLLDEFAHPSYLYMPGRLFQEQMQYLFKCGLSERVEALPFKVWRDHITNMIQTADYGWSRDNSVILVRIQSKLAHFEDELTKLKEITTILELALWKMKMIEKSHNEEKNRCQKKMKADESSIRQQCRVICGADVVIGHVLPFLITV
jgi:hypothetical protein